MGWELGRRGKGGGGTVCRVALTVAEDVAALWHLLGLCWCGGRGKRFPRIPPWLSRGPQGLSHGHPWVCGGPPWLAHSPP